MLILPKMMKKTLLILSFTLVSGAMYAEDTTNDAQTLEEVAKFSDENSKMREDHIQQMRELHIKHVNEMYDRKLAHNKELTSMWKQLRPGDKKANKELRDLIHAKKEAFEKEDEEFKKEFKETVLKKKNKEFRHSMKGRMHEMKKKFKD